MKRHAILAAGMAAGLSISASHLSEGDAIAVRRDPPKPKRPEHKHSREIARRLRQEARKAAKATPSDLADEAGI